MTLHPRGIVNDDRCLSSYSFVSILVIRLIRRRNPFRGRGRSPTVRSTRILLAALLVLYASTGSLLGFYIASNSVLHRIVADATAAFISGVTYHIDKGQPEWASNALMWASTMALIVNVKSPPHF